MHKIHVHAEKKLRRKVSIIKKKKNGLLELRRHKLPGCKKINLRRKVILKKKKNGLVELRRHKLPGCKKNNPRRKAILTPMLMPTRSRVAARGYLPLPSSFLLEEKKGGARGWWPLPSVPPFFFFLRTGRGGLTYVHAL